jgi:hypothetical protein
LSRVEAVHICALSFWLAALVVGAGTAILGFRVMRLSEPALPEFAAYEGEHWRLLAGLMADRVFDVVDGVGVASALVAGLSLALAAARGLRVRRPAVMIRVIAVLLAALLVSVNLFVMRPLLGQEVRAYRDVARAGDLQGAQEHREAYDVRHAIARGIQTSLAGVVLVALVGAVAQAGGPGGKREGEKLDDARGEAPTAQSSGRWHGGGES